MHKFNWGILSTAKINQSIIDPIRSINNNFIKCIGSRSLKKSKNYSKIWNIPYYTGSYEELVKRKDLNIIYISLPNSLHYEWIIKSIRNKKHVLCEKPLTISSNNIDRIKQLSKRNGVIVCEALMYRHHLQIKFIKKLLDDNFIGRTISINIHFAIKKIFNRFDIRLNPMLGGGVLWDLGYYPISFANYIANSDIECCTGLKKIKNNIDYTVLGGIKYKNGLIFQFHCSFDSYSTDYIEIVGTEGRIFYDKCFTRSDNKTIIMEGKFNDKFNYNNLNHRYYDQILDINNAIINKAKPEISMSEIKKNIFTIEKLFKTIS